MLIGVPKETKVHEYRAGLTPDGVRQLTAVGHEVVVQRGLGAGVGLDDALYERAGARVAKSAREVFAAAQMIVKVKEPQPAEFALLRPGQILFTYLHLAADAAQTAALVGSGAVAIAYETVTGPGGTLPLLAPMSEIAGSMSVQVGASFLELPHGGSGVLLCGAAGVEPAQVVVLGAGTAGCHAVQVAVGMGAHVTVLDRSVERLRHVEQIHGHRVAARLCTPGAVEEAVSAADLAIGAVLVAGAAAPRLVSRALVARMRPGSVVVDISIDQGGCFETSRATTHERPTYIDEGVVHYCVTNMPGAVARTSTFALTAATLPFVLTLATDGWRQAVAEDPHLRNGLNVCCGEVTCQAVAEALGHPWREPELAGA